MWIYPQWVSQRWHFLTSRNWVFKSTGIIHYMLKNHTYSLAEYAIFSSVPCDSIYFLPQFRFICFVVVKFPINLRQGLLAHGPVSHSSERQTAAPLVLLHHTVRLSSALRLTHMHTNTLPPAIFNIKHKWSLYFVVSLLWFHPLPICCMCFLAMHQTPKVSPGDQSIFQP